jgi:hypothetical protein
VTDAALSALVENSDQEDDMLRRSTERPLPSVGTSGADWTELLNALAARRASRGDADESSPPKKARFARIEANESPCLSDRSFYNSSPFADMHV